MAVLSVTKAGLDDLGKSRSLATARATIPPAPEELGAVLWFDASDTSTISESGGAVSQWNDKSGNGYHVTQATAANQPTTGSSTLNGLNVISFDGTNDNLVRSTSSIVGKNTSGATTYCVARWTSLGSLSAVLAVSAGGGNSGSARLQTQADTSSKAQVGGRTLDADSFATQASSSSLSTADYFIVTGGYDYANTDLYVYLGSTLEGTNNSFQSATTTSNTDSELIRLGASASSLSFFTGYIAEIVVFNGFHSPSERSTMWTYLANKWGLTI